MVTKAARPIAGLEWMMQAIRQLHRDQASWGWATVAAGGDAPTVVLDADEDEEPREVSDSVAGPVVPGQRVHVLHREQRITIVGAAPAPWRPAALTGGWVNYHTGFAPAAYRRLPHGVQLRGLIRGGTVDKPAFTVDTPPDTDLILGGLTWTGSTIMPCRISVKPTGEVIPSTGSNPNWVSLDGIMIPI